MRGAARARLGLRLSKCQIVGGHVSRLIYNGKKVSGLDYWLSRELNCEVPHIICYYICQENSYHIKVK